MRDEKIDIMRFVGLAMIILAHIGAPPLIWQLRNFDVPLMVLVSGLSLGFCATGQSYAAYVWKRIKRLVFPVWIFLTAYFLLIYTTGYPIQLSNAESIPRSYLLLSGYSWIIRVFVLVALVAPVLWRWNYQIRSHTRYWSLLGAVYLGYELLRYATIGSGAGEIFESTVLYLIPYALVFAVGLRLPELSRNQVLRATVGLFVICSAVGVALYAVSGKFIFTQEFKYPPSLYYLSYALGMSGVVWLTADALLVTIKRLGLLKPVLFVAQNSMWIYLWHMPFVDMFHLPFYIRYPCVFASASLATLVQVKCVNQMRSPNVSNASKTNSFRASLIRLLGSGG